MRENGALTLPCLAPRAVRCIAALALVGLAGCAGDLPIPFLNFPTPSPLPDPPPQYPSVATPVEDPNKREPILTEADQKAAAAQLDKHAAEREAALKRRIQTGK